MLIFGLKTGRSHHKKATDMMHASWTLHDRATMWTSLPLFFLKHSTLCWLLDSNFSLLTSKVRCILITTRDACMNAWRHALARTTRVQLQTCKGWRIYEEFTMWQCTLFFPWEMCSTTYHGSWSTAITDMSMLPAGGFRVFHFLLALNLLFVSLFVPSSFCWSIFRCKHACMMTFLNC